MEKQSLPKLELEGFTIYPSGTSPYRPEDSAARTARKASWRDRAFRLVRRRGRAAGKAPGDDVDPAYRKLLIKTGICAAIAIALLVISTVETPGSGGVTDTLNRVVSHEFDIDKDIGRLKFVQTLDEVEAVFSEQPGMPPVVYPANGDIVTEFGKAGSKGVRIEASGSVRSIARSTVTAVGEISGAGYVVTVLDTGETMTYYNIDPVVQVDDIVEAGPDGGQDAGRLSLCEIRKARSI